MSVLDSSSKYLAVALCGAGVFLFAFAIGRDPSSIIHRYWAAYCVSLERKLRNMFLTTRGAHIAAAQLLAMVVVACLALGLSHPYLFFGLPLVALAPAAYIERMRRERLARIENKVDSFILTLANALKSTPSIGNALAYSETLISSPMDEEIGLALKEIRVGTTVDQALLNMSARIRSPQLDATLAGILIGRQVGGDLPRILETTAETLREIARLQGVVRSKTAEGKAQLAVLAVFPALLLVVFDLASPGYFAPLTQSFVGWIVIAIAVGFWVSSIAMARGVLMVDI
ncbi:MAG: type II secretion system F family protein [Polyangiaceae bacterium]